MLILYVGTRKGQTLKITYYLIINNQYIFVMSHTCRESCLSNLCLFIIEKVFISTNPQQFSVNSIVQTSLVKITNKNNLAHTVIQYRLTVLLVGQRHDNTKNKNAAAIFNF